MSLTVMVLTFFGVASGGSAPEGSFTGKTAAQAFKNIQVLKTIPADQLVPTMQFISASLGVECDFCHVEREMDKDDKKPKKVARSMMQMMLAINANNFAGERKVSCNTCHRGRLHPQAIPAISTALANDEGQSVSMDNTQDDAPDPASLPSGNPVFAAYVQALGGPQVDRITSRVEKGNASIGKGKPLPLEIFAQSPDRRVSIMHFPNADSVTAYNGRAGWLVVPGRPLREMSASDQEAARLDAAVFFPTQLMRVFDALKLQPQTEMIDEHATSVVLGLAKGQAAARFYFDRQSGLLLRMLHYTDTALGLIPTQVDFFDYRGVGGVKTPFRWTIARPGNSFTIQLDQVLNNVPIDPVKFVEPVQPPSAPPVQ